MFFPFSEGVEVTCNQNDIQVQINRSVQLALDPNNLHLIDNNCRPSSSNGSFINFNITLGTCGTFVVISNDGVNSFYRNEIINNSTNTTEFDIICSYIREPTQLGTGEWYSVHLWVGVCHWDTESFTLYQTMISLICNPAYPRLEKLHYRSPTCEN